MPIQTYQAKGKKYKPKKITKKSIKEIQDEAFKKPEVPELIAMRSETQSVKNIDESDRAERISIALEMVLEDMKAMQGEANARKAVLTLNSEKMKEHVGRLCDDATRRRKGCESPSTKTLPSKTPSTRTKTAPSSIRNVKSAVLLPKPTKLVKAHGVKSTLSQNNSKSKKTPVIPNKSGVTDSAKSLVQILSDAAKELRLDLGTGSLGGQKKGMNARKGPVTFCSPKSDIQTFLDEVASKPKPGPFLQQFPNGSCLVPTKVFPPFKTCIDLTGYANENISLDLYGRRVVVVAYRPKDKENHARKVTDIVDIPDTVELEHLTVARRPDGWLVMEEILPKPSA